MVGDYLIESIKYLDASCFKWINGSLHNSFFDGLMPLLSYAGQGGLIWIALGLSFFIFGRRSWKNAALLMLLALFASFLVDEELLKNIFRRPRPFETFAGINLLVLPPDSYSFPSAHTANAFAAGLVLARKIPSVAGPVLALALLIAFSRVYVGVHYPLDILAGALVGAACALFVLKLETRIFRGRGGVEGKIHQAP
ncbi:MAG: phosphatase PAP2 family protein [Pelotomaculaceae bacterium]|jgi:undecaprenyl-diphosphatase|nr:phosphatase PAP2 family protein [Bacillota bacterium]HHU87586.1 phosphatase PAP2 family protein [Peptococcaceae bacterium]